MRRRIFLCLVVLLASLPTVGGLGAALAWAGGPQVQHTPWLALRFVQDGAEVRLARRDLYTTEVRLRRAPFQIRLPTRGKDDVYLLTAWTEDSIFASIPLGRDLADNDEPFSYFAPAGGIADTEAGSGTLYLNNEGHLYLGGLRLGPDPANHVVLFSTVFSLDGEEQPMARVTEPLYLVVFHDEDDDGVVENGEYDFVVLNFRS